MNPISGTSTVCFIDILMRSITRGFYILSKLEIQKHSLAEQTRTEDRFYKESETLKIRGFHSP